MADQINFQNLTQQELFEYLKAHVRPALERHLLFRSRFRLSIDEIQDLVQETLLRFWEKRIAFQDSPMSWLKEVANNLYIDAVRRKTRIKLQTIDEKIPAKQEHRDVLLQKAFFEAFRELKPSEAHALYLTSIGMTQPEIAEEMDAPQTTVAYWIRTAKERLRQNPNLARIFEKGDRR